MPEQQFHSTVPLSPGNQIYLERPRIDVLFEKIIQNPVVIVVAGAGYGKTHAVYSFVRNYNARISWMQLSERDNIGSRFWENFIGGVGLTNPKAAERLAKITFPETERQLERYMTIPLEEIDPAVRVVLVYDDFHLVTNPAVLRFMEKSVNAPFPGITSVFISRTEPLINTAKFFSKGLLGRITEGDLRFSREEMTEYFSIQNIRPGPETLTSIYHDTEGWAFAIHLAGLSLKNAPPGTPYIPQAMRVNIFRLIESEVMGAVSKAMQRFLIKLSLIEHLFPEVLQDLAGNPELIKEMDNIDTFVRFDIYSNAYHIHHLFLNYLKTRQHEIPEAEQKEVWYKTAVWCEANNQKMDAISYYEKVGDYERLIAVCSTLPMMHSDRIAQMLLETLDKAPPEVYETNPFIHTHRVRIFMSLGMLEQAENEIDKTIERLEKRPPTAIIHQILTVCYANKGFIRLMACTYTGDFNFIDLFERCAWHSSQSGGWKVPLPMSVVNIGSFVCRVHKPEKGETERYIHALEIIAPLASRALGGMQWGTDTLARTEFEFFKGNLNEAEQLALESVKRARERDQYEVENRALFYLLRIYLVRGNFPAIRNVLKQLESQLDQVHYINRFTNHDIVTGWYYSQIGQMDKVARWLKNDFEGSDLNSMNLGLEVLVKARCHMAEGRYSAALAALSVVESRKNQFDPGDFLFGLVSLKVMDAVCRYHNRDKSGAFASLETAYRYAAPNGLDMPFIAMGKDMRALAGAALKDKAKAPAAMEAIPREWLEKIRVGASAYAKKLFAVAEHYRTEEEKPVKMRAADKAAAYQSGVELSRREKQVLASLSQGMTRAEIAAQTSLSVNTVKSVIRSVYNKLGALNKADAVRIAASMNLV
ncbi:MAG: LuxR C-terminal-related transcriptional regulator [Treponema sp.]|jgi:LuxR family maltose regulon positive regulatory protein|nr:LuxR C-terminal-related transcriptional regulator [Treponema sp.]